MQESLMQPLRALRFQTRVRWEALLRTERTSSPLANPDSLVHLLDWTLDEIFHALACPAGYRRVARLAPGYRPRCACGHNPLLAYFAAGEQAMREALILAQAAMTTLCPLERDAALEELNLVLAQIARQEIEAFCGVCQHGCHPFAGTTTSAASTANANERPG
jgi:hypothetical protein